MLNPGNNAATEGMAKAIYDRLQSELGANLNRLSEEQRIPIHENWKKMAYAIAKGVIEHIIANMEIYGITTQGDVNATVTGTRAVQNDVEFTQNNDGPRHVR